ncbi:sensor histidine kinase [Deinococcus maricopensis]|uniref:histidine kinase n=1 Tax=Deinococcus maricopensis (strain DSM 21211 / LMG 22137 / NRRL B-23946 / LB-34) TaxID=709986 RepID=E8UAQ0_DEIML|nr:ATP-binding protein [Deinococcus maricopensis]ADV68139.1 PAS/PAC sensor signal transduction histidine kinase [Deinococcus maricopensis DSM 21211]
MPRPLASPARYAIAAFDALTAHIAILNADGVILAVNNAWRRFAQENGGTDDVGTNYLELCDHARGDDQEDAHRIADGIRDVLAGTRSVYELEYPCHSPNEQRYFLARVTCFMQDGARYAVVAHENITRRKRAELEVRDLNRTLEARVHERTREVEQASAALAAKNAELERSVRDLREFAYVASHDLQEPLRTLGAYSDLLRHRYADQLDDRARGYLTHITEQVFRARQLVRDVLTLSNVSAQPPLGSVDMRAIWTTVSATLPWPEDATATCGALPPVRANLPQVQQLLTNLLGNAIKFRADRPLRVLLSAWQQDGWVEFALSDNGIGIPGAHAERVFVMFQRLHSRQRAEGNGIGLAVCRKIVERHGGRIWMDTRSAEGLTVRFTLPAMTPPPGQ